MDTANDHENEVKTLNFRYVFSIEIHFDGYRNLLQNISLNVVILKRKAGSSKFLKQTTVHFYLSKGRQNQSKQHLDEN